jgi:DMSO/TMAO reductase YedYZ molybdopterin-dependent catalytic subunit
MKAVFGGRLTRRELLKGSLLAGGTLLVGFDNLRLQDSPRGAIEKPFQGGRKLGVVEFTEEQPVPMGKAFGMELDKRQYADLSRLSPESPAMTAEEFYIRTGASELLESAKISSVELGGLVERPFELGVLELVRQAKPMGLHVMECAGNVRAIHFGMMSAADWTGVQVGQVVDAAKLKPEAARLLVSGFDRYATPSVNSVPGASWIFTLEEIKASGAFLATAMNGQPLTRDHGAPIRLVVPGWYGCACIKWVNELTFVEDGAGATSQMQEYAARTMQKGVPHLAKDYEPATVDHAAMPIRVEKWSVGGKIKYRVTGILWGGASPVSGLEIRFNPEEDYVGVTSFQQSANNSWSFWTHAWQPKQTGTHMIRVRLKDTSVVARRMNAGYYLRTVEIMEI